ncbi:hypothetical protein [Nannocystis bainbridge]|uniref:Uncharacterized protein n=1 Tax=Nannocystis bainbridge TaxID=2995303 RepID=A0ABT5DS87_9BACT|nr:hypothetical protein [Nannocystis bainbridge]MDC0716483.1 hypothetical protein [Nannocystis bainbridge]
MSRAWLALACLFACTSSAVAPEAPVSECAAKVAQMRAQFAQGAGEPVVLQLPGGGQFPPSSRGVAVADGLPVFVMADGGYVFDTQPLTAAGLQERLAEELERAGQLARNTGQARSAHLLLAADAGAPARALAEVAGMVPEGTTVALVVAVAGDVVPAPPSTPPAVQAVLAAPAEQRASTLAALLEPSAKACAPIGGVFEAVRDAAPDQRSQVLLDGLPGALEQCRCEGVDFPTLLAVAWQLGGKTAAAVRQLGVPLTRAPEAEGVALPATVAELVPLLEGRDGRPFRLDSR